MNSRVLATILILLIPLTMGCAGGGESSAQQPEKLSVESPAGAAAQGDLPEFYEGKVVSTHDSGGYTYVEVDTGSMVFWAAGPESVIKVGDSVQVQTNMMMKGFYSETLDKTYDEIFFTMNFGDDIQSKGFHGDVDRTPGPGGGSDDPHAGMLPPGHPSLSGGAATASVEIENIAKPDAGYTIAEIWSTADDLGGKEIVLRGQVVKFMAGIMQRNWIRLQDGTGEGDSASLTVTTDQAAKVGDIVLVKGKLRKDADFGAGYFYKVILEEASVTVE